MKIKNIKDNFKQSKRFTPNMDNLRMKVRLEFDCDHPHSAYTFLRNILEDETEFEVGFNSNEETCWVLIEPDNILLEEKED